MSPKKIFNFSFFILVFFLVLSYKNAYAVEISSSNWGVHEYTITNATTDVSWDVSGAPWGNWRYGYLRFAFAIRKESGTSTSPVIVPRAVIAWSGSTGYICDVGSNSTENSTMTGNTFSAMCPMDLGAPGVTKISIAFLSLPGSAQSTYAFSSPGYASFEQAVSIQVDTLSIVQATNNSTNAINGVTSAVASQTSSINYQSQVNTQAIISNNNTNTSAIISSTQQINGSITNDDVTGANSKAGNFFNDFSVPNHNGISGIVTSPLRLINALVGNSCTSLSIPLPFVNNSITLPCMSSIYSSYFSSFLTLYQLITTGIIAYWVIIKLFGWVRRLERPDDDRIEVLNL